MKKILVLLLMVSSLAYAQTPKLDKDIAEKLSILPLHCMDKEYPNKTAHTINSETDAKLTPSQLHPGFYGCFDWHSSVHGHWMLVHLLKTFPNIKNKAEITAKLNRTFTVENMQVEADYFKKYELAKIFERTYGWAWLLKLDQELLEWNDPQAQKWHAALQPLTQQILELWKAYLPKQTYPNRTGVHGNTAFALVFALDWARATNDKVFEVQLMDKAKTFYLDNEKTPAYMEPDGADFFSPSLEIADLMRRVLIKEDFVKWLDKFYEERSIKRISDMPVVSDLSDYQTVHLVGLSFTRAWCMKGVAAQLPNKHPLKKHFEATANHFLANALPLIFKGNYGGDHWLASFAVYALSQK
ncbi:DUF2891 domain-containing protein [Pedobacter helvus]|uniref:DUF2891 domain-containing protein n=1 Tax=Pedobacter helvus TaxID=2563444 RepID=A0ABW9JKV1_9SPHI|nr:DUF2891 domain-containing protein [Pedobacter ureilyticus]